MKIDEFLTEKSNDFEGEMLSITKTVQLLRFNDSLAKKAGVSLNLGVGNADADCLVIVPSLKPDFIYILERIMEKVKKIPLSELYITSFWKIEDKKLADSMIKIVQNEIKIINPNVIIVINEKMAEFLLKYKLHDNIIVLPDFQELVSLEKLYVSTKDESIKEKVIATQKEILNRLKGFKRLKRGK